MFRLSKVNLFGLDIYAGNKDDLLIQIEEWINNNNRYTNIFTPNVDHICKLEDESLESFNRLPLKWTYREAFLIPDGMPLVWASRLLGTPLKERIPGSDLLSDLLWLANSNQWSMVFVLPNKEVKVKLKEYITDYYPNINLYDSSIASFPFEGRGNNREQIANDIWELEVDIVLVCLGFPRQERWLIEYGHGLRAKLGIGLGASPEFLVGMKKRAPKWIGRIGMEWLHRALTDRRLIPRYLSNVYFLWLVMRELLNKWRGK
ncbi:WecB/TagA/CpsF family glycosyltransferase [Calothrix sp. FACHB-1219]|uniref:WecB/TagA/CpsF family glycosyltransferase n=1 Tax=unclassified Calothrix TaxID=2619626 RepID=UPI0016894B6C|nr:MULTISPECIES: WecB/TagA/CpsF family glycosyltransferase [unclassified Calothrix]MBD2201574.1 WecB/TagA/CpsF family glycosyltransferase [Calothrix sp. FACHB-168]MBD2217260.1 WecB/TagA/CpsF family glycosyltransferase [Calothrix sp. FACHB-1219]